MEYIGKFKHFFAIKDSGWFSGIFELEDGKEYNASGVLDNPLKDITYKITGTDYIDPKWGPKLKIESAVIMDEDSLEFIKKFLTSGLIKGVGEGLADRLIKTFGENTLKIIEKNPEKLLEVKGISKKKQILITESYDKSQIFSKLYEVTNGKITPLVASKIITKYGKNCVNILKKNPYELIYEIGGIGFSKADAIAESVGIAKNSLFRIQAAIVYVLMQMGNAQGHCYSDIDMLQKNVIDLILPFPVQLEKKKDTNELKNFLYGKIGNVIVRDDFKFFFISEDQILECINWVNESTNYVDIMAEAILKEVEEGRIIIDEEKIYWKKYYDAEVYLGEQIYKMCNMLPVKKMNTLDIEEKIALFERYNYQMASLQKDAVKYALTNRISVITGGPGRGKTTIINLISEIWNDDEKLILCAPTGRASQRMRDASGREAKTVYKTIYEYGTVVNTNVKDCLIIVDESSMIDIILAKDIIKFAENNQIVFVGDTDQLPSVGPGSFFRELVQCPIVPTIILKKGFRNSGSISDNSDCVNEGKPSKYFLYDEHFTFDQISREQLLDNVIDTYIELMNIYGAKNVAILSPMKANKLGSNNINERIREKVNHVDPDSKNISGFHINDRVMVMKNDYEVETYKNGVASVGIFNGDCGHIADINSDDGTFTVYFDDGRMAEIENVKIELFQLAYAITIHKSQGSEYPYVIIPIDFAYYVMLKKNLLYTAISRAKEKVIIKGDKNAVDHAIRTVSDDIRNTNLNKRILSYREAA